MYFWTHAEAPISIPQTPGRLSMISWPPTSPTETAMSPCALDLPPSSVLPILSPEEDKIGVRSRQELRNSARDVEIMSLEDEIRRLRQEIEKYKTLIEIQTLTNNAVIDFSSPIEENKSCDIIGELVVVAHQINNE